MDFKLENALKPEFKHVSRIVLVHTKNRKTVPGQRTPKRSAPLPIISRDRVLKGFRQSNLISPYHGLAITIAEGNDGREAE